MAKIPNKITLTLERLQSIYDELRPVAYQNRLDGNLTEEQLNDASIDCCLTDIDLIKWQGSSPGFAFSGIWYGNPELLKDIYAKAVELDEADGHLDGQISMGEGRTGLTFHTGSEKTAENDWRGIITPYKMGIFTITVTFGHDPNESTGTAWVIEREGLGNGMYRYWVITNAHVVDRYDDDETSHKIRLTDDGGSAYVGNDIMIYFLRLVLVLMKE